MTELRGDKIDIGLRVLDHQLLDSEDVRCGKVDDVLFEEGADGALMVTALLTGPRAQRRRLPKWLRRMAGWIGRDVEHRVPWEHVAAMSSVIELNRSAEELGLGDGDRRLRPVVERLPKA